jgi:hypothetical protein
MTSFGRTPLGSTARISDTMVFDKLLQVLRFGVPMMRWNRRIPTTASFLEYHSPRSRALARTIDGDDQRPNQSDESSPARVVLEMDVRSKRFRRGFTYVEQWSICAASTIDAYVVSKSI